MVYRYHPPTNMRHSPFTKKLKTLNALHTQWTALLAHMEDLTRRHLRTVTETYQYTCLCACTMKHLRDLRSLCDRALVAKHDYHKLPPTHLQGKICMSQLHHQLCQHVSATTEAYTTAKCNTRSLYTKSQEG